MQKKKFSDFFYFADYGKKTLLDMINVKVLVFYDADVISINSKVYSQTTNIGWSNINTDNSSYYFCHSYYLNFYDKNDNEIIASINLKKKFLPLLRKIML